MLVINGDKTNIELIINHTVVYYIQMGNIITTNMELHFKIKLIVVKTIHVFKKTQRIYLKQNPKLDLFTLIVVLRIRV